MSKEINVLDQAVGNDYVLYHGDSCEVMQGLENESIGLSVFSPPFSSLYTYSNDIRDLSNSKNDDEFFMQFQFMMQELFRITKKGRNVCMHVVDLPTSIARDGYTGLRDFSGMCIKMMEELGFTYHCRITIWKDPVVAMQRTKAVGLLHKTIKKDSAKSRVGHPEYILVFTKPGENQEPISHTPEDFPVATWQQYASPVWMDIRRGDTLQRKGAKDEKDEKHISPLQLSVIERCVKLWSNPNDIVFTPFMGIGSEVYEAVRCGRRGIGIELKDTYFSMARQNMDLLENAPKQLEIDIFGDLT